PIHLTPDRHIHDPLDPLLQTVAHVRGAEQALGGAAPPLAHRRGEHRAHRVDRALADAVVEIVERAARPERLLEAGGGLAQPARQTRWWSSRVAPPISTMLVSMVSASSSRAGAR